MKRRQQKINKLLIVCRVGRQLLILLLITVSFQYIAACGSREEKNGGNEVRHKIPREQMVQILADISVVESILTDQHEGHADLRQLSYEYYDEILKKHKVSRTDFRSTLEEIMKDQGEVDRFLGDVLTELTKRKEDLVKKTD